MICLPVIFYLFLKLGKGWWIAKANYRILNYTQYIDGCSWFRVGWGVGAATIHSRIRCTDYALFAIRILYSLPKEPNFLEYLFEL